MKYIVLFLILTILPNHVNADESPWTKHLDIAESRIISAKTHADENGAGWFAWELRLKPGWKVYWRSPGEAGLPPKVMLKDGSSAKSVTPYFPLPKRFELFGLQTFGYGLQFVLPFKLEGSQPEKPIMVDMTVDFMICKDVCIPFTTDYSFEQSGGSHSHSDLYATTISLWMDKVPDVKGDDGAGLKIISYSVKGTPGHQSLVFEVEAKQSLANADILIEAESKFKFGKPKINLRGRGNKALMVVSVNSYKKDSNIKGGQATVTFTDGRGHAIERKVSFK